MIGRRRNFNESALGDEESQVIVLESQITGHKRINIAILLVAMYDIRIALVAKSTFNFDYCGNRTYSKLAIFLVFSLFA